MSSTKSKGGKRSRMTCGHTAASSAPSASPPKNCSPLRTRHRNRLGRETDPAPGAGGHHNAGDAPRMAGLSPGGAPRSQSAPRHRPRCPRHRQAPHRRGRLSGVDGCAGDGRRPGRRSLGGTHYSGRRPAAGADRAPDGQGGRRRGAMPGRFSRCGIGERTLPGSAIANGPWRSGSTPLSPRSGPMPDLVRVVRRQLIPDASRVHAERHEEAPLPRPIDLPHWPPHRDLHRMLGAVCERRLRIFGQIVPTPPAADRESSAPGQDGQRDRRRGGARSWRA